MPPAISEYCRRVANTTIGATTLRKQGAAGVVAAARAFVAGIDLSTVGGCLTADAFAAHLDFLTDDLVKALPAAGSSFGAARKAINLYLAEAYYHQFVCRAYGLDRVAPWMEVPLDSQTASFLAAAASSSGDATLVWPGIKWLTPADSARYQAVAAQYVARRGDGWLRVHVDVIAWGRAYS